MTGKVIVPFYDGGERKAGDVLQLTPQGSLWAFGAGFCEPADDEARQWMTDNNVSLPASKTKPVTTATTTPPAAR